MSGNYIDFSIPLEEQDPYFMGGNSDPTETREGIVNDSPNREVATKVHEAWRDGRVASLIHDRETIGRFLLGEEDSFRTVAERAFRELGLPAVMCSFVKPQDRYVAEAVLKARQQDIENKTNHKKLGMNAKRQRFDHFYGLVAFPLRPDEKEKLDHELTVAAREMEEMAGNIDRKTKSDLGSVSISGVEHSVMSNHR